MFEKDANPSPQSLRVVYVGPNMDVFLGAYQSSHDKYGHTTEYIPNVAAVGQLQPAPDVAVISPMVLTPDGVDGACALQAALTDETLIVAIYTTLGPSHSMYARHALGGRCHPRMLLHYPNIKLDAGEIVATIDRLGRHDNPDRSIHTTGYLPRDLQPHCSRKDLGQILSENIEASRSANDSLTFARLLHEAATNRTWSTWGELAFTLGFGEGHVKNTKARIGHILTEEVLVGDSDVGAPDQATRLWRIGQFVRFVTEHQSFIRAYCQNHLDCSF